MVTTDQSASWRGLPIGIFGVPLETELSIRPIVFQSTSSDASLLWDDTTVVVRDKDTRDDKNAFYPFELPQIVHETHVMILGRSFLEDVPKSCRAIVAAEFRLFSKWGRFVCGDITMLNRRRRVIREALLSPAVPPLDRLAAAEVAVAIDARVVKSWAMLWGLSPADDQQIIVDDFCFATSVSRFQAEATLRRVFCEHQLPQPNSAHRRPNHRGAAAA